MDYSQFLNMFPEATLMAILVIVFLTDFAFNNSAKKHNMLYAVTGLLMAAQIAACVVAEPAEAFGGLYVTSNAVNVMKIILTAGTLIVIIMAQPWLQRADVSNKEGEFYELVISTLLGMYMMMSSGHFLMFFLGLEMASVPMACLVAFDKLRKNSAEGAAKFILTATFSSGVMLYGISFIYGAVGTLYFEDVASLLYISPMTIMGLVFFFSGLGFKISLVPFHFWTADTYQGAPTAVTGYLSVISKGAASFTLMTILMKVFAPMVEYWEYLLYIVIVLSITIANLFAIRQKELKRFMAFSSISQAGYIMLAVVGNSAMSVSTLTYYVLVYVVANMSVFTCRNTSFCRNVQQVLCVHGCRITGFLLCIRSSVHSFDKYGCQSLLLPAYCQGDVHKDIGHSAGNIQERLQYQACSCLMHGGYTRRRSIQLCLRLDCRRGELILDISKSRTSLAASDSFCFDIYMKNHGLYNEE